MNLMERNHREEEPDWREDIRSERMEEGEEQEDDLRVEDLDAEDAPDEEMAEGGLW